MFCLITYPEDNILNVVRTKQLRKKKDGKFLAPYKRMGYYQANPIIYDDSKITLLKKKTELEENSACVVINNESNNEDNLVSGESHKNPNATASDENTNTSVVIQNETENEQHLVSDDLHKNPNTAASDRNMNTSVVIQNEIENEEHLVSDDLHKNPNTAALDENMNNKEEKLKSSHKRHCCYFCKKIIFQIVRHWQSVHSNEDEVRVIMRLHGNNPLRIKKINSLRRKGDYEFNKSLPVDSKDLIVSRISTKEKGVAVPCPSCLGYFSKENLRHHKRNCSPNNGSRRLQGNSRKLMHHIHERASETLRTVIAPDMFHDNVANQFLFDEILVIYGNYLCIKYTEPHLRNYIRAQLRLMGRFMLQVKSIDQSISDCKDLIQSKHIDTVRQAVDQVAEFDLTTNTFQHPTNARTVLTELRKLIQVVKSESDKMEDEILMKRAKAFSRRLKQELAPYVNRVCKNSENKIKRAKQQKVSQLPENIEIAKYLDSLYVTILDAERDLQNQFSSSSWKKLTEAIMVYLAVFNRKRPGETQRIELIDFYNRGGVKHTDLAQLNESEKAQADKYERIGFRGKLGNSTALLIDRKKILPGIQLFLKYRELAGVHPKNRFLFAKPSKTDSSLTFNAYICHKQFCENIGINPEDLTFTKLRMQFATEVAKKGTSQEEERRVSTYMSHDFNIHKKIYDHSAMLMDITKVSKHLENTVAHKEKNEMSKSLRKRKWQSTGNHSSTLKENTATANKQKGAKKKYKKMVSETSSENESSASNANTNTKFKKSHSCEYMKINHGGSRFTKKNKTRKQWESDESYNSFENEASSTTEDEPSLQEVERCLGKFQTRKFWNAVEKKAVRSYFQAEIFNGKPVENDKLKKFKYLYREEMKDRSIPLIKQWIEKQKTKIENRNAGIEEKRPRFSTPEIEILNSSVERHSIEGSEPSFEEFRELIATHDAFQGRTVNSLAQKYKRLQTKRS